jgi:hypothetical protein
MKRERIYLAGRFDRKAEFRAYAERIRALGHGVVCRWLDQGEVAEFDLSTHKGRLSASVCAANDLADLLASTMIVVFTKAPNSGLARGGRHFEAGWAFALGNNRSYAFVGPVENVFYALPSWSGYDTFEDFLITLEAVAV